MTAHWRDRRVTGIIGVPGDRADKLVEEAGRVAAKGFNQVFIKEDRDLRGRETGEVAALLCRTIHWECATCECRIVLDEVEALRQAVREMRDGEVIVIFYDKLEPVLRVLEEYEARPTMRLRDLPLPNEVAFA